VGIVVGVALVIVAIVAIGALMMRESARRRDWYVRARAALGEGWSEFAPSDELTGGLASEGKVDGKPARFFADRTSTNARLDAALPENVDRGPVFNLIVRDSGGAVETGRETVSAGFDDEHGRLVFKSGARRYDPERTVRDLVDEAKAFRARLPELLAKHAERRREIASKTFGPFTREDGRHAVLGLAVALSPEEWELAKVGVDGSVTWERLEDEERGASELRLTAPRQHEALGEAVPRQRMLEGIARAYVARLPDGSFEFEEANPEPNAADGEPVAGLVTTRIAVDYQRELEVSEEKSEFTPYRYVAVGVFAPWAVALFELTAPREQAQETLGRVLASASFLDPREKETQTSPRPEGSSP
jgi:hypothetical protein